MTAYHHDRHGREATTPVNPPVVLDCAPDLDRGSTPMLDVRIQRLALDHEAASGPAPAAWAWLALGSEGRGEPSPEADQDHALVLAAPGAPGQEAWARGLAGRVEAELAAEGVPVCPGGFHASRWCLGLDELCARARTWLEEPTPGTALEAAAFLDARPASGDLDVAPLRAVLARAPAHPRFLRELARAALSFRPPGPIRLALGGALDPKREALAPLVLTARVLGTAAACPATGTLARLEAARAAGLLGPDLARDAAGAWAFLFALRRRADPGALRPGRLPPEDRAGLRRALDAARRLQDATARLLGLG
jgi:CBS domain-containing protein